MPSAGPDFGRLHQLLQNLKRVQDQLQRGPRQIKARQKKVVEAQNALSEKEAELKSVRAESDKKNLDLKTKESNLVDFKRKLNAAKSNREFEIISGQIDADIAAKAVLEDEIIEYLDRVDALQKEIEVVKTKITQSEEDARNFASEFESKAVELQDKEKELREQVKDAQQIVPKEMREQFGRLVNAYGPEAMAECVNSSCSHCFVKMTPQSRVMLNSGKVLFCGSCGRLNYLINDG